MPGGEKVLFNNNGRFLNPSFSAPVLRHIIIAITPYRPYTNIVYRGISCLKQHRQLAHIRYCRPLSTLL